MGYKNLYQTLEVHVPLIDATLGDHFIQLQPWYYWTAYGMFASFFITSMRLIKKYRKEFTLSSYTIIFLMNAGFLARAIVYNHNTNKYADKKFLLSQDDKTVEWVIMDEFIDYQQNMMISACINWTLNMFFDVVVLKMMTVYFTFQAKSREQAIKVQTTINSIVKFFLTSYLFLGIVINIFSYIYLEDFSVNR